MMKDEKKIEKQLISELAKLRQRVAALEKVETEHKRTEEALRKSEERYKKQFEEAMDAIFIADAETSILVDCNRAALELVSRKKSELVGKHQRILHPPEEIEGELSRTFKQHLKEKEGQILETQVITKKGEIKDVAIKASIFELEGKKVLLGIFRDITELKQAEEEVQHRILELATLNEIGRAIASTIELDELWELIYQQTCRLMEVSAFYIALYDREKEELYNVINMLHGQPRPRGEKRRRFGNGRTEYVIRASKPLLIRGEVQATYGRLGIVSADKKAKSFAGVPIAVGSKVIGVLAVQNYERDDVYDKHNIELLSTIANHAAIAIENARLYGETQGHLKEMTTLQKIGMELTSSLDLSNLLQDITESTLELTNADYVHIFSLDPKTGKFTHRAAVWPPQAKEPPMTWPRKRGLTAAVFEAQEPVVIEKASDHPLYSTPETRKWGVQSVAGFPLKGKWGLTGVLNLAFLKPHAFSEEERNLLSLLADQAAIAIENARLYEKTQQLAITDGLTGLYNHRYFYEALENELQRSDRYQHSVSLIILDIDNFKAYNDRHGHLAGDNLLMELAQLMSQVARTPDTLARYGGEEFTIILPETGAEQARSLAQRLLDDVRKHRFAIQDGQTIGRITISLGVATYPHHAHSAKALVDAADKAMLQAKRAGKNRIAVLRDGEYRK